MNINIHIGIPQAIYIVLSSIGLIYAIVNNGKPRGNYNVWDTLFGEVLLISLLLWGGFFK